MSFTDKAKNKVEELSGAARERIGDMTDNERMRAEGASQQSDARARQAGENVKEAGRNTKDAFTK
ncbi:CsbD family protein [Verrucosispora sp. WMMA2044]|uniref:CsbD family protein n=1 Tax=Verrucosispora sioxanthis TaxID=2499994 RepID=A0A6M1LCI8_9ACTN|nr:MULTISPECIES: CsbD family protein [Micromonospora]NEE66866.1 CsbD family protein [Verrucosispora sioxanthis]NGM15976.1 CsbD family protein [Verrucosispora sioxanthis]WBB50710.1 CsbD family protein [Verrucosispora sp. WMMA2044]